MIFSLILAASLSAPPPELSTIAVPIEASLAPLLPLIEAQVPKTFARTLDERVYTVRYNVERDRIALKMIGAGLHSTTVARYSIEACPYRLRCVDCGIREAKRQATIHLQSTFTWDQQWRLRSTTTPQPARFPNRCALTMLNIDITDRYIAPIVNDQLRDVAKSIDRNTPGLTNMRPVAQQVWSGLQTPVLVAPRTWLVFEPVSVALAPPRGDGLRVTSMLSIAAKTRITIADRAPAVSVVALPALRSVDAPAGLRVPFDIHIPYGEASAMATTHFGNRKYKLKSGELRVGAVEISPAMNGRIRVEAEIDYEAGRIKRYAGPIVLDGTPQYDATSSTVTVPDLEYTVDTRERSIFFRAAERIAHDEIRDQLRRTAKLPLAKELAEVRAEVTKAMNRTLARGVALNGRIDDVRPRAVYPTDADMIVRVDVTGSASVKVAP